MRLDVVGLIVFLVSSPVLADPVIEERSFVVVKPSQKAAGRKRTCTIQGRIFFRGAEKVPPGALIMGLYGTLSERGELMSDDTEPFGAEIQANGEFKLEAARRLPIVLTADAPGFEPAFIVLSTCDVSVDFMLGRAAN